MSEDDQKKTKIDLKARLGKKTVAGGPSIPPPMTTGTSIPAPPFASSPSHPAPVSEPPRRVEPQAIKIEMGEEVLEAQKKGRVRLVLIGIAAAIVGGVVGYAVGGGAERSKNYEIATKGAELLKGDVDKANTEVEKLAKTLKAAKVALGDGRFPEAEVNELGGINIPFDGTYLVGKGIGLMDAETNRLLVKFAGDSASANDQKDALKRALAGSKKAILEMFEDKSTPKIKWGVVVTSSDSGPVASMQLLPSPFPVKGKSWPEEFELQLGKDKVKLPRYTKGDVIGKSAPLIPVDPSSQSAVCATDALSRLSRELANMETILAGDTSDPTNEKLGLVDTGNKLVEKLKGVGH